MIQKEGRITLRTVLAAAALAALLPAPAAAAPSDIGQAGGDGFAAGEVLVRYEPGTSRGERKAVRNELGAELERRLLVPRLELLELDRGESVRGAVATLATQPAVAFAEPNYVYRLARTPNDVQYLSHSQWPLNNNGTLGTADADIDAPEAWDTVTGDPLVAVAVVDGGISMGHADLDGNIWSNPGESGGGLESNGLDDDGNGKVDDHRGWDWVGDDNSPIDEEGHGTHVAGIIGAEGDNTEGIAGVNWDVSLMPLRACNSIGVCLNADVADAFAYAGEKDAGVVNASLSGTGFSFTQQAAIAIFSDTLFVAAAGNDANDNDASPRYPCSYAGANLICVGASTSLDTLASYSNFGSGSVDLVAPGGSFGGAGSPVNSTFMTERMNEAFEAPLGTGWDTGGTPDTWDRTTEASGLPGATLTDSPGAGHGNNTNNFARFGPVNLSADVGCQLRYDLDLDLPDTDDRLHVQTSTDDFSYATVTEWTGVGKATLTPQIPGAAGSPTAYIRFRLVTDPGDPNGTGAHIDNVRIRCASTGYRLLQGTSMAAPHVAGAAALLLDEDPTATIAELREWLLDGADLKASLDGRVASSGRLNLARALSGAGGADIRRPQTTIVGAPATSSKSTTATFSFVADEPATFACSHNGADFSACPSPRSLAGLAIGTHSFRVRAIDLAGNEDATPASYSFTVEPSTANGACAKLRKKLRAATSQKQRSKLRKKIKKRCKKAKRAR